MQSAPGSKKDSPLTSDRQSHTSARDATTKRTGPKGRPGAGGCFVSINYFFSSSIAALALSAATDDFPALHATSASLTSVEAFLKLAERGDWLSCVRGGWMSWVRGDWMSWLRGDWMSCDRTPANERGA